MWRSVVSSENPRNGWQGAHRWDRGVLPVLAVIMLLVGLQASGQTPNFRMERIESWPLPVTGSGSWKAVAFGDLDFNGDGTTDIVYAYRSKGWTAADNPPIFVFGWYQNTGNGWSTPALNPTWEYQPGCRNVHEYEVFEGDDTISDIQVGDVNADGRPDVLFCTHVEGVLYFSDPVLNGNTALAPVWARQQYTYPDLGTCGSWLGANDPPVGFHPNVRKLALADVTGDGRKDIIAAIGETGAGPNQQGVVRLWKKRSSAGWDSPVQLLSWQNAPYVNFPVSVRVENLISQNSAAPEIFICGLADTRIEYVYSTNNFAGSSNYFVGGSQYSNSVPVSKPFDTGFADIDKDGLTDLILVQEDSPTVKWLKNTGNAPGTSTPENFSQVFTVDDTRSGADNPLAPRNDPYPIFVKGGDMDLDGDGDIVVSYNSLTTAPGTSYPENGQLVYYENTGYRDGSNNWVNSWTAHVLVGDPEDTNPMNIDIVPATHPSAPYPDPADQEDLYPDLLVINGTPSLSMWDNRTYQEAPYVKSLSLITPSGTNHFRQLDIEFSKTMKADSAGDANDALNPNNYTLTRVGGGSLGLTEHPDQVQPQGGNKFRLIWDNTDLKITLGITARVTVASSVVENDAYTGTQARLRAPFYRDVTVPGLPTANFVPNTTQAGLAPLGPIEFRPTGSTNGGSPITNYIWDFGDGSPLENRTTTAAVFHTYAMGWYTPKLTVVTAWGQNELSRAALIQAWPPPLQVTQTAIMEESGTPNDDTVFICDPVQFTVTASDGLAPYTYLWQYSSDGGTSWANISNGTSTLSTVGSEGAATPVQVTYTNADTNTLSIDRGVQPGKYRCRVTASYPYPGPVNQVESAPATLSINQAKLTIVGNLQDSRRYSGQYESINWTYVVIGGDGVIGSPPNYVGTHYIYRWYKEGIGTPQATTRTPDWGIDGMDPSTAGRYFSTVYWDSFAGQDASASTNHALLEVADRVEVTNPTPTAHQNTDGSLTLSVSVTGGYEPLTYRWYYDNGTKAYVEIIPPSHPSASGATTEIDPETGALTVTGVQLVDAGGYRCTVSDSYTSSDNSEATAVSVSNIPVVTTPSPTPQAWYAGQTAAFSATADDGVSTSFVFQWQRNTGSNWVNLVTGDLGGRVQVTSSGTGSQISISGLVEGDSGSYRCSAKNVWDPVAYPTVNASLNVYGPLEMDMDTPSDKTENMGREVSFTVSTTGGIPPLQYAWEWCTGDDLAPGGGWQPLSAGVHPQDSISPVAFDGNALKITIRSTLLLNTWYRCTVTDNGTPQTAGPSREARLRVTNYINIEQGPQDVRAYADLGEEIRLTVTVSPGSGVAPYTYEWKKNGTSLSGGLFGNEPFLDLGPADLVNHPGSYTVTVRDSSGSGGNPDVTSEPAIVRVANTPTLTPANQLLRGYAGDTIAITVSMANGFTPYTYEWRDADDNPLGAPSSATLTLTNVPESDDDRVVKVEARDAGSTVTGSLYPTGFPCDAEAALDIAAAFSFTDSPDTVRAYNDDEPFVLTVAATGGFEPLTYTWKRELPGGGEEIVDNSNTTALRIDPAEAEEYGPYDYFVEVTDTLPKSFETPPATIEIDEHLDFVKDLEETYQGAPNDDFSMGVETKGGLGDKMTYVWSWNPAEDSSKVWQTLPEENEAVLSLSPLSSADAGEYQVVVSDQGSTLTGERDSIPSIVATLVVTTGVPVGGALGLSVLTALTALGGALTIRRRK